MSENLDIIDYGIDDARKDLPRYAVDAHKYTHGTLLVAGGSREYSGAPMLAATAGLYAGAGIVKVCIPQAAELFCHVPQALIVHRVASDSEFGVFSEKSLPQFERELEKTTALVLGPGMCAYGEVDGFLKEAIAVDLPKVLDADALNRISRNPCLLTDCKARSKAVLTPHDGEFRRLVQAMEPEKDCAREQCVREMAVALGCVIVLKGSGTLVASPDGMVPFMSLSLFLY
ncbi:MAG: NAD(P)H-hydrate dehydratase, partial [Lentisphaeria bacterium]|nr:NAD(P)H-hydrate dehydratase [Lentisphaeria bacterium]